MHAINRLRALRRRWKLKGLRKRCRDHACRSVVLPAGPCWVEVPVRSDLLDMLVRGRFEEDHVRVLASLVRAGDTCIDVGANIGLMSLEMARLVGPTGRVLAFEPEPLAFRVLLGNLARNAVSHVQAFNLAASDQGGSATLELPAGRSEYASLSGVVHPSAGEGPRSRTTVQLDTLDQVALPVLDGCRLVKLDTEGHEFHVVRGALGLIARWRPYLSIEIVPSLLASHASSPDALLGLLDSCGYQVRDLAGSRIDESRLGTRGYHQFLAEPR